MAAVETIKSENSDGMADDGTMPTEVAANAPPQDPTDGPIDLVEGSVTLDSQDDIDVLFEADEQVEITSRSHGDGILDEADVEALLTSEPEDEDVPDETSLPRFADDDEGDADVSSEDDQLPPPMPAPSPPDVPDSVESYSHALMASVTAFQEAERRIREAAVRAEREEAERRIAELMTTIADLRAEADEARAETEDVRADAEDVMAQLSQALDQVRQSSTLVNTLRYEIDTLNVSASAARKDLDWAKEQWSQERNRADSLEERVMRAERQINDAETTALALRSEIESLRRVLSSHGVRPMMSRVANDDMGAQGTAIFPVQVTAVIDCKPATHSGDPLHNIGVGVVFDVRLVAAIPPDPGQSGHVIESAVGLARALFPTAPLSVIVSDDCDLSTYHSRYGDVTFVAAPTDDSRRKAARVLANAAGHMRRSGTETV